MTKEVSDVVQKKEKKEEKALTFSSAGSRVASGSASHAAGLPQADAGKGSKATPEIIPQAAKALDSSDTQVKTKSFKKIRS